ncbi:MAG: hypothetical protein AAGE93_16135 [Bacteroidota bacterium]
MESRNDIRVFFVVFIFVLPILIAFPWKASLGQTVVGMGTDSPNPNAVLELVAKDKNQGLLIPRLSDDDLISFARQLTSSDQGLLVFAEERGKFCYWWNDEWNILDITSDESGIVNPSSPESLSYLPGEGISIEEQTILNTGDLDSTNELQSLASVLEQGTDADQQRITNVADPVDNQDVATRAFVLQELQSSPSPTLQYDNSTKSLSLSGGNTVDLSNINTDEQDVELNGNVLSLTNDSSPVNLSATAPSNGQVLTWNNTTSRWESRSVPGATPYMGGVGIAVDASNQITNTAPDQTVALIGGGSVSVSGTYPNFTISGSDLVDDADNNPSNETITSVDLLADGTLRIQEAGTNHEADLSVFQKKELPTSQILVGNAAGEATPVSLSGDVTLNPDGTMTITVDAVTTAKIINQAITTAKLADNAVTREKINGNVAGSGLSQAVDGSLQTSNTAIGEILIGQGTQATARPVSGDVALAADGGTTIEGLQGRPVSTNPPLNGQVLTWNGSSWEPDDAGGGPILGSGKQWYSGSGIPTALNPADAEDGNFYYETDSQIVYYKEGGSWTELGGFNRVNPVSEINGKADSYRTTVLYIGDEEPVEGDDIGSDGDLYYSRTEAKLFYRFDDGGTIKWQSL